MVTTHRCSFYVDLSRELWSRVDQKNKGKSIRLSKSQVGPHNILVTIPHIGYPEEPHVPKFVSDRTSTIPSIYVVTNPIRGLLDRKIENQISEEHLESSNESMETKTKQKTTNIKEQHKAHARKRSKGTR